MSERNETYRAVIQGVFEEWRRRIREVLESAVRSGEVRKDLDTESMARHIVATVEGGIMGDRASRNPADLEACIAVLTVLLGIGDESESHR